MQATPAPAEAEIVLGVPLLRADEARALVGRLVAALDAAALVVPPDAGPGAFARALLDLAEPAA